jgi:hypothetical protein
MTTYPNPPPTPTTGQKPDRDPTSEEEGKDPAAVALGKKGGRTRAG